MADPTKCPICPGLELQANLRQHGKYRLFGCQACGVNFWWPLEFAGKSFYDIAEFNAARTEGEAGIYWRERQFLKNPPISRGRLLEVGCGKGRFLWETKKMGFDVWGVDISEKAIAITKKFYDLPNVFRATLSEFADAHSERFDIICFFEVLEHQNDPIRFLSSVKKLLKPGGYIVLSVPNLDRLGINRDQAEFPPNHPFRYRARSLAYLLEKQGFKVQKISKEPFNKDFFFQDGGPFRFGIISSLRKKLTMHGESGSGVSMDVNKSAPNGPQKRSLLAIATEVAARTGTFILNVIAFPIAIVMRLAGFKWWDMYAVARSAD